MLIPDVNLHNKNILVTGTAGFIGFNPVPELLRTAEPVTIVGLDNGGSFCGCGYDEDRGKRTSECPHDPGGLPEGRAVCL